MKLLHIFLIVLMMVIPASATISGVGVVTNLSTEGRAPSGGNYSINISFTESTASNYTNFTFPASFNFSGLALADILNNTVASALSKTTTLINLTYPSTAAGVRYFNFTVKMKTPSAAGDYTIGIATSNSSGGSGILYVRNASRPYYLQANNSIYTISSESWTDTGTTITTSGKGNANLTINVPAFSSSINISRYGYTATNAKMVQIDNSSGQMFIIPDPDVQDPVIVVTQSTSMQESNLPIALTGAGAITAIYIIYRFKKRIR